jgi:hypothetical protein
VPTWSTCGQITSLVSDLHWLLKFVATQVASPATSTYRHDSRSRRRLHSDLGYTESKFYLQLNIFTTFISFADLLYMFCLPFRSLPLDMLEGLAMPTRRSPDQRVQFFYLVLCSPPPRHARGLGHANLRVARPVGSYLFLLPSTLSLDMLGCLAQSQPRGRST